MQVEWSGVVWCRKGWAEDQRASQWKGTTVLLKSNSIGNIKSYNGSEPPQAEKVTYAFISHMLSQARVPTVPGVLDYLREVTPPCDYGRGGKWTEEIF